MAVRAAAAVVDRQRGAALNIVVQRVAIAATAIGVLLAGGGVVGMAAAFLPGTSWAQPRCWCWPTTSARAQDGASSPGPTPKPLPSSGCFPVRPTHEHADHPDRRDRVGEVRVVRRGVLLLRGLQTHGDQPVPFGVPDPSSDARDALRQAPLRVGRIVRALFSTAAVFYFPLAVAMLLRGSELLDLLYGQGYGVGGRTAMVALAWALIMLVALSALTYALLVIGHSRDVAAVSAPTLLVKFIIVWPLVDRWPPRGGHRGGDRVHSPGLPAVVAARTPWVAACVGRLGYVASTDERASAVSRTGHLECGLHVRAVPHRPVGRPRLDHESSVYYRPLAQQQGAPCAG